MRRKPICPNTLATLYDIGETLENIAAQFDCDMKTIRRRADTLGLRHPHAPQRRRKQMDESLSEINVIERYQKGDSLMELAADGNTSVDVVRRYLERNSIKIRTRTEQVASTMEKYGTRFHKNETRLYRCKWDANGLISQVAFYRNKSRRPVIIFQGDNLTILRSMPDASVDLIATDDDME